jgi:hypothetical protein
MRREFGLHDVAALPAELNRFHMLHSPIAYLTADKQIRDRHYDEEHADPAPGSLPIGKRFKIRWPVAPGERDSNGDQGQPKEEKNWDCDEYQQTYVWIIDTPTDVNRKKKQPGAACQRDQRHAQHGDPVAGQQNEYALVRLIAHLFRPASRI